MTSRNDVSTESRGKPTIPKQHVDPLAGPSRAVASSIS